MWEKNIHVQLIKLVFIFICDFFGNVAIAN